MPFDVRCFQQAYTQRGETEDPERCLGVGDGNDEQPGSLGADQRMSSVFADACVCVCFRDISVHVKRVCTLTCTWARGRVLEGHTRARVLGNGPSVPHLLGKTGAFSYFRFLWKIRVGVSAVGRARGRSDERGRGGTPQVLREQRGPCPRSGKEPSRPAWHQLRSPFRCWADL